MGLCSSACHCERASRVRTLDDAQLKSRQIEQDLKDQMEQAKLNHKLLLLGAGESGKSTVVKQLRMLHRLKVTSKEMEEYVRSIRANTLEVTRTIIEAMQTFDIPLQDPDLAQYRDRLLEVDADSMDYETVDMINALRADQGFVQALERRDEYWLLDAYEYYFDNAARFVDDDFVPTDDDMVMTRVRTTGVVCSELKDPPLKYTVVDVGGQRSERRKWIHCFDDVKAVLFLVGLSGYAQVLFEDQSQNRMVESVKLFGDVVKLEAFRDTPIVLLLNKKDLFERMIATKPIRKIFPEYTGPEGEMAPALEFIKGKYREVMRQHCPGKDLPIHVIAARVRLDMKIMFSDVKQLLASKNA